ncbi:hypothetical protein [Candidatus Solirubrobacter pratensis]|uniref:hypothetical protein n=1 Tax=Candidatus Solirubrobacter pratensis TaxID=1298857 RepID=UPI00040BF3E8|nr:hypothetical protein [Candidatus Solirubrobacter pratensis]
MLLDRRRASLALMLLLGLILGLPGRARADTPINMSPEQVRQALIMAGDVGHLSHGTDGQRDLLLQLVLLEAYAVKPDLAPADAVAGIQALQARVPTADLEPLGPQAPNQMVISILQAMDSPHPSGITGDALSRVLNQALQESARTTNLGKQIAVDADSGWTLAGGTFDPTAVLSRAAALGAKNAKYAQAWDTLWQASAGYSILAGTPRLLSDVDALKRDELEPVVGLIAADGTIATTVQAVDQQAAAQTATLQANALATIDSVAPGGTYDLATSRLRDGSSNGAGAATSLLSKIAGAGNSSTGKRIAAAGAMLGKLTESYSKWSTAVAGVSGVSRFANLSTLSMAGGVLGAMQMLGPVLGLPDQNAQMLQALAQISEQIDALHEDMTDRFNQVDAQLDALNSRLDTITSYLSSISGKIDALQDSVDHANANITQALQDIATLQVSIDRLQANMYQIGQDAINTDTWRTINGAIGYQQGNPGHLPLPAIDFFKAAGDLFTFGTTAASGSTLQPIAGRSWAPDDLVTELEKFSTLDSNLEYLRQLPAKRLGLPALGGADARVLANPQQWALSSHAHSQLLLENPAQTTATQLNQLRELSGEGDQLHDLMRQIGTSDTSTRSGSTLFNALIDDYKTQAGLGGSPAATSLVGELKKDEATYLATLTGPGSPAVLGLDLWGGPDQPLDVSDLGPMVYLPLPSVTDTFTSTDSAWPLTPTAHKLAVRLGLGTFASTFSGIEFTPNGGTPYTVVDSDCFVSCGPLYTSATPAQIAAAKAAVKTALESRQRGLYAYLATRAADNSTPLYKALRRVQGDTEAIEAYLRLGLGTALTTDDQLEELLTDGNRLLDPAGLASIAQSLAAPASTLPSARLSTRIPALQSQRLTELEAAIKADLAPAGQAANARAAAAPAIPAYQGSPLVDGTLNRLALTESVIENPPAPDGVEPTPSPDPTPTPGPGPSTDPNPVPPPPASPQPVPPARLSLGAKLAASSFTRKRGTRLTLTTDGAASVKAVLSRTAAGRRSGTKCVAPAKSRHGGKACTRVLQTKTVTLAAHRGTTVVAFGRGLTGGTWTATLSAAGAAPVKLTFRVK